MGGIEAEIKEQVESKSTLMAFFEGNSYTDPDSVWFQKEFDAADSERSQLQKEGM